MILLASSLKREFTFELLAKRTRGFFFEFEFKKETKFRALSICRVAFKVSPLYAQMFMF